MNNQTFSNLNSRPLLNNFFRSDPIELREMIGEKILFVFVGNTRLALMFRKLFHQQDTYFTTSFDENCI